MLLPLVVLAQPLPRFLVPRSLLLVVLAQPLPRFLVLRSLLLRFLQAPLLLRFLVLRSLLQLEVLEVVEVLLKEGNARPSGVNEDSSCLSMLGDFVQYRPYALSIDRTKDEIARIVPAMVNLLVEADPCILGNSDCHFTQASILSSPEAMRVLLRRAIAEDDPPCFNDVCCRFGSFRNRVQELSAVESLYVLVREFGVVKEHPIGGPPLFDCALVVLVGNALSEAVVMMIDNIGADPRVVSSRGKTLRQIAQERASNRHPVDPEGQRILDFLDARGL